MTLVRSSNGWSRQYQAGATQVLEPLGALDISSSVQEEVQDSRRMPYLNKDHLILRTDLLGLNLK